MQHKGTRLRQVNVCLCVFRTLQVGQKPEVPCMSHCNCYTSSVSPVCGSNGVTYLSSCFAGCTRTISTGLPPPPRSQVITHLISDTAFVSLPFFPVRCHTLSLCTAAFLALRSFPGQHMSSVGHYNWSPHRSSDIQYVEKDTAFCLLGILMAAAIWASALITIQSEWFKLE